MKEEQDSAKIEKDHCVFCQKYFSSNDAMKEHILRDHKMKSFPCPNEECDRTFTEKKRMLEHVHVIHMNIRSPCTICGKMLANKQSVERHIVVHHVGNQSRIFKCQFCDEEFVDQYKLGGHRRRKHPEEKYLITATPYECTFCGKQIQTKFSLNKHLARKHSDIPEDQWIRPERENRSQCKFCEKSFEGPYLLQGHTRREHPRKSRSWFSKYKTQEARTTTQIETANLHSFENDNPFEDSSAVDDPDKASVESQEFPLEDEKISEKSSEEDISDKIGDNDVQKHLLDDGEPTFEKENNTVASEAEDGPVDSKLDDLEEFQTESFPKSCDNNTEDKGSQIGLKNMKHVDEKVTSRHKCQQCTFSCDRPSILKDHVYTKHEGGEIKCSLCKATFQKSKNLREHTKTKHAKEKILCDRCDFKTNWPVALVKHQESQHGIVKEKPSVKSLSCEKCDYVAKRRGGLVDHIIYKHEGTKHKCEQCPSSFVRERDLRRHMATSRHKIPVKSEPVKSEPSNNSVDENLPENPLTCKRCQYIAEGWESLAEHILTKHANNQLHHTLKEEVKEETV